MEPSSETNSPHERMNLLFFAADPSVLSSPHNGHGSQQEMLEAENDGLEEQLRDKVRALKTVRFPFLVMFLSLIFRRC